jgi:hypothetical protein
MNDANNAGIRKLNVEELRKKHPVFTYESFTFEHLEDSLKIRFQFILKPDICFSPEITFNSINKSKISLLGPGILENLAFHIGLVEMLSYWKAACSPEIVLTSGSLDSKQIRWWKDMVLHGMREFFYMNNIVDFKRPDFFNISIQGSSDLMGSRYDHHIPQDRNLVLVSGGKDSAFTLEFLNEIGEQFTCLLVNPTAAATIMSSKAGCNDPIIIKRTIDPNLLSLNEAGYLNGHTPFSALLAFLGVTCAVLLGYKNVIVSNERSCDEGNIRFLGSEVNHQYSKTFRFECRLRDYVRKYLAQNVNYFSLLRPLYEIQISRLFAGYPQYFEIFKSCNRAQSKNSWCKHCAKCLFIFATLYPFLEVDDMNRIFGEDLFMHRDAIPVIQELTGLRGHKPFECVGTEEETLVGLYLSIKKARTHQNKLPLVLQYVEDELLPKHPGIAGVTSKMLSTWSGNHNLPREYAKLLRERVIKHNETR